MPTNRVVFGTSTHAMYSFFAPLTALMWQRVGARTPLPILIGTRAHWEQAEPLVLHALEELGAEVRFLSGPAEWEPYAPAQLCRLYAYLLPGIDPDDDLLTTDVDAWPLQAAAYRPRDADVMVCMRHGGWHLFPIGYLWAKARVWREILGSPATTIEQALEDIADSLQRGRPPWSLDEEMITAKIKAWSGYPNRLELIERPNACEGTRLSRCCWPAQPIPLDGYIDSHHLRPGWMPETWPRLHWVFQALLPPKDMQWVDDYYRRYMVNPPKDQGPC